ncbi:MAG: hypothetical protein WDN44_02465 [Sphingomonas sp.]
MLTVERMADDILAVMDGAGVERATVVGHAAGGSRASRWRSRRPSG